MSGMNTFFNGMSAAANRRTAVASEATSRATRQLADSDRQRELRARGLITYRSTPDEIADVEQHLAAQMRARQLLRGEVRRRPYSTVVMSAVAAVLLALTVSSRGTSPVLGALAVLVLLSIPVGIYAWIVRRREERYQRIVSAAEFDRLGRCGWCGRQGPHVLEGVEEHPRIAHALEIEAELAGGGTRRAGSHARR